ncbi:MAG: ABC transporter substrate-binding protein [Dehalococcoidia bacterium]
MPRWLFLSLVLSLSLLATAACGDDDDGDGDDVESTAEGDDDAGQVIDITGIEELEDGNLVVLSDVPYAPIEFFDENDEIVGFDVDIAAALAEKLGVEFEFVVTGFDAIIPSLNANDGDIIMSAMSVNPERDAEVDFVEYATIGTGIAVRAGNPDGITGFADLCGRAVSVQANTVQEQQLADLNEGDCADDQIDVSAFPEQPVAEQELADGNVDAMIADYPVVFTAAEANPEAIEALDVQEEATPYGIAYRTASPLGEALQQAFDAIVAEGTYDEILEKWNLTSARIE